MFMTSEQRFVAWPEILGTLAAGSEISALQARDALRSILADDASDAQTAAFIVLLRLKGPSVGELLGLVEAMRDVATRLDISDDAVDIVGTGGTPNRRRHALNVSTMAAFVAAAAGAVVCKHGSVKASSTSGSFDMLDALGLDIAMSPNTVEEMVRTTGIGFAFAKTFHPAMRYVAGVRSQIGIPTVFNLLGPLAHPGNVKRQVLGVADRTLAHTMAAVLQATGSVRSMVVYGEDGYDEFSTTGTNLVVELRDGRLSEKRVDAADVGLRRASPAELHGGDAHDNAAILSEVLSGEPGAKRDMVVFNAAAALCAADLADDLSQGVEAAAAAIDDGRAAAKVDSVIAASRA